MARARFKRGSASSSLIQALSRLSIETGNLIYFRLALSASLSQRSAVATDGDHTGSIIGGVNRPWDEDHDFERHSKVTETQELQPRAGAQCYSHGIHLSNVILILRQEEIVGNIGYGGGVWRLTARTSHVYFSRALC